MAMRVVSAPAASISSTTSLRPWPAAAKSGLAPDRVRSWSMLARA